MGFGKSVVFPAYSCFPLPIKLTASLGGRGLVFNATFNNISVISWRFMNSSNNHKGDDNTDNIGSYNSISHQVIIVLTLTAADFIILCRLNISNCEKKV